MEENYIISDEEKEGRSIQNQKISEKKEKTETIKRTRKNPIAAFCQIYPNKNTQKQCINVDFSQNQIHLNLETSTKTVKFSNIFSNIDLDKQSMPSYILNEIQQYVVLQSSCLFILPFGAMNTGKTYSTIGTKQNPGVFRKLIESMFGLINVHIIQIFDNQPYDLTSDHQDIYPQQYPLRKESIVSLSQPRLLTLIDQITQDRARSQNGVNSNSHLILRVYCEDITITVCDIAGDYVNRGLARKFMDCSEQEMVKDMLMGRGGRYSPSCLVRVINECLEDEKTKVILLAHVSGEEKNVLETETTLELVEEIMELKPKEHQNNDQILLSPMLNITINTNTNQNLNNISELNESHLHQQQHKQYHQNITIPKILQEYTTSPPTSKLTPKLIQTILLDIFDVQPIIPSHISTLTQWFSNILTHTQNKNIQIKRQLKQLKEKNKRTEEHNFSERYHREQMVSRWERVRELEEKIAESRSIAEKQFIGKQFVDVSISGEMEGGEEQRIAVFRGAGRGEKQTEGDLERGVEKAQNIQNKGLEQQREQINNNAEKYCLENNEFNKEFEEWREKNRGNRVQITGAIGDSRSNNHVSRILKNTTIKEQSPKQHKLRQDNSCILDKRVKSADEPLRIMPNRQQATHQLTIEQKDSPIISLTSPPSPQTNINTNEANHLQQDEKQNGLKKRNRKGRRKIELKESSPNSQRNNQIEQEVQKSGELEISVQNIPSHPLRY